MEKTILQEKIDGFYNILEEQNNKIKFNVFEKLELQNKELIHSLFIAELLKANDICYNEFMSVLITKNNNVEFIEKQKVNIIKEQPLKKYGRADIWIGEKNGINNQPARRIIIENKLYAGEQWRQLDRYDEYLKDKNKRDGWLFYLTIEGKNASKNSATNAKYTSISYVDIKNWLEKCLIHGSVDSELTILIKQYIAIINPMIAKYQHANLLIGENESFTESRSKFKDKLSKEEFKAILEYNFWIQLEEKIDVNKTDKLTQRRRFSYEKVLKRNNKNKLDREYGLIINNKDNYTRISIDAGGKIRIRQGYFSKDNEWISTLQIEEIQTEFNKYEDIKPIIDTIIAKI